MKLLISLVVATILCSCTVNRYHYDCGGIDSKAEFKATCKRIFPKTNKREERIKDKYYITRAQF